MKCQLASRFYRLILRRDVLLTITTTHQPATDLGYLLGKHPARAQRFELPMGDAHVFYPEASEERCTAALLLDIDPVALVRGTGETLGHYVNDRPYAAGSMMAVALARVIGLSGESKARPELARQAIPLELSVPVLRCRAGADKVRAVFAPLPYERVEATALPLDSAFPEWGGSPYVSLRLCGRLPLAEALSHLYVLLPALDGDKHYYVGEDEVQKLLLRAGRWLRDHPERNWITDRYLKRQRSLVRDALSQLIGEDADELQEREQRKDEAEAGIEKPLSLNEQRMQAVRAALVASGASSVVDLGCGEGRLLGELLREPQFDRLLGIDVSSLALERAADRLKLDRMPAAARARIALRQSSLTYRDSGLKGFDAAAAVEVIEHIDAGRLEAVEANIFGDAAPRSVIVTTPNAEFNVRFAGLAAGAFRHGDHRFEWTREQFRQWCDGIAGRFGYRYEIRPIGPVDADLGAPTQMAVFTREVKA
jgi:3' terminal RNA ribose 2'-O-methyltransferase Hen1